MKKTLFPIFALSAAFLALFFFRDALAGYAWRNFNNDRVALRLVENDAGLAFEIGEYYFIGEKRDLNAAEIAYKRTLEIDSDYPMANYQLARVYFVKGQTELALEAINKELEFFPKNQRSYYVRGLIYGFSGRLPEAEDDFRKFTQWSRGEWAGWNDLAWILAKEGKFEEDLGTLNEAFQNVPDAENNIWLQNSLGLAHLNLKKYKNAETAFLKAKELSLKMPIEEWLMAYPGNGREDAKKGFEVFIAALDANLSKARYSGELGEN